METQHSVVLESAARIAALGDGSVDLIVTSPPYPMIEMWDASFADQNPDAGGCLQAEDGPGAYRAMHETLDTVWHQTVRVLRPGGFLCINIGDATRKIGANFRLYPNHARITEACEAIGLQSLPAILWRKQTNAPNKFMGSGMLPSGAYVTLEHEYILIFRQGDKRRFPPEDRERRRASAFFWEERNQWFSDLWDFKGVRQRHAAGAPARSRSGAFPLELAFRLINMYSLQGDTVLDPFLGTGTTTVAAMAAARNSVGFELDSRFSATIDAAVAEALPLMNERQRRRLTDHREFVSARQESSGTPLGYHNQPHDTPVMTKQETDLALPAVGHVQRLQQGEYQVHHTSLEEQSDSPQSVGFEGIGSTAPDSPGQLSLPLD